MATVHYGQVNPERYNGMSPSRYENLRGEMRALEVGCTFKVTCLGRYSARCTRQALTHYCRNRLGYQVEAHQFQNVVEIKRTK